MCKLRHTHIFSIEGNTCCPGLFWNTETSSCENCPIGYHSINCSEICSFPSFGEDCQDICKCDIGLCDFRFGCTKYNGETSVKSTVFLRDNTYDRSKGTTPLLTKNVSFGTPLAFHNLPSTLIYILIGLVGIFTIICGIFVGTYFYKHCIRQSYSTQSKNVDQISNQREEYNSLELNVHVHEESIHSRDQTYLEPVFDAKPHYEEIISPIETTEQISQTISEQTEHDENVSLKLQRCFFSSAKRYKRPWISTNSL